MGGLLVRVDAPRLDERLDPASLPDGGALRISAVTDPVAWNYRRRSAASSQNLSPPRSTTCSPSASAAASSVSVG